MLQRASPLAITRSLSRAGALSVMVMGAAVLAGWILHLDGLKQLAPGLVTMKANTALCFIAAGLALTLMDGDPPPSRLLLARGLAAVVLVVGVATLGEYLFDANWGLDQFLLHDDPQAISTASPGRMAAATALSFAVSGLALLVAPPHARAGRLARWLPFVPLTVSTLAVLGYAYGVRELYAMRAWSTMALHTAIGILVLSLSILTAHPNDGFLAILTSDTAGGLTARRLLPITTLALFTLGWVRLVGQRAGLYGTSFGLALMVGSAMLVTSGVVAWHARLLHNADLRRRGTEAELLALNESLEQRVLARTGELRDALSQVRQLSGLLPVCAWCKRIRDDQQAWHTMEEFVSTRSEATFTHGVCPDCRERMLREELSPAPPRTDS